ncbi:alpha/beta fold hydrolase [soil metagenome]
MRLLVIPGLHGSGDAHWQTWLQSHFKDAARVEQDDWTTPDLDVWARRVGETIEAHGGGAWVAAAHSFGTLALARYLQTRGSGIAAALFVAPADPAKFAVGPLLPQDRLPIPSALVASDTDPWMKAQIAHEWAQRWGSHYVNLGDAGHINVASGHGPLPRAKSLVTKLMQRVERDRSRALEKAAEEQADGQSDYSRRLELRAA